MSTKSNKFKVYAGDDAECFIRNSIESGLLDNVHSCKEAFIEEYDFDNPGEYEVTIAVTVKKVK